MDIIKEYYGSRNECTLRLRTCDNALSQFERLFDEANRDFVGLEKALVEVEFYREGQDQYVGIAFTPPQIPPASYRRLSEYHYLEPVR